MPEYSSLADLERAILDKIKSAVEAASSEIKEDMLKETHEYYTGTPVMYQRTYKLAKTPEVSDVGSNGKSVSFKAYLNSDGGYPHITYTYSDGRRTTSKAPSMTDVLNLTNYGTTSSSVGYLHPAIGRGGYWERAKSHMQKILDDNLGQNFSRR